MPEMVTVPKSILQDVLLTLRSIEWRKHLEERSGDTITYCTVCGADDRYSGRKEDLVHKPDCRRALLMTSIQKALVEVVEHGCDVETWMAGFNQACHYEPDACTTCPHAALVRLQAAEHEELVYERKQRELRAREYIQERRLRREIQRELHRLAEQQPEGATFSDV